MAEHYDQEIVFILGTETGEAVSEWAPRVRERIYLLVVVVQEFLEFAAAWERIRGTIEKG
jgi:hypothetical protein